MSGYCRNSQISPVVVSLDGRGGAYSQAVVVMDAEIGDGQTASDVVLGRAETEIAWALRLLMRLPNKQRPAGVGSQLGGYVAQTGPISSIPSAADITRACNIYEAVLGGLKDDFERRVVLCRGLRMPWIEIRGHDPRGRTVRQIQRVYRQAIGSLDLSNFFSRT